MSKTRILVAEDDVNIRLGLVDALSMDGYEVREAADGSETLRLYTQWQPELLLLDLMMPKVSGFDVCRRIRNGNKDIPIIMLTAKGEEIDKVLGLELGADDYVTKPFSVRELVARIAAVLRRSQRGHDDALPSSGDRFQFAHITVDAACMTATIGTTAVPLTAREIELLRFFAAHPGEVLERDRILGAVWGNHYGGFSRTLDQHIAQLRKKIEPDPKAPALIETVYGIGYRFRAPAHSRPRQ
ncbi:MAG: response regulator transcription factor [Victivallales bacterium]|nr:response regulator transcription factor [Victivallales bacterium]